MLKQFFTFAISLLISLSSTNLYAADAEKGKKLFKKCAACHNVAEGAAHKTGPNLWGIYGAKAAVQDGYKYSKWLQEANIVWDDKTLTAWIAKKKVKAEYFGKDVKKSKMIFSGFKKPEQMVDMIEYLKTLK